MRDLEAEQNKENEFGSVGQPPHSAASAAARGDAPAALHTSLKSYDTNVGISGKRARSPEDQFEEMDDDEFLESLAATNNGGSRGSTPNGKRRKQDILQHKDSSKASFFFRCEAHNYDRPLPRSTHSSAGGKCI